MSGQEISPAHAVRRMALGYIVSRSIAVVVELGIPDLLRDGPKGADELASATGANGNRLYRILRILAGEGVFREEPDRFFSLTPLSQALRTDVRDSVHAYVAMKHELEFPALMHIMDTVRTGESAFVRTFGKPAFEWLRENPGPAVRFHAAMRVAHGEEDRMVADAFGFSGVNHVVDVGGGNGSLLSAVLDRHEHVSGTLLELEPAIAAARSGGAGDLPRCELVTGDFFEGVTPGADVYILKKIIHNWSDGDAITILRNCRKAMNRGGKVLIVETPLGPANESSWGKIQDFTMLLVFEGGMERTTEEYAELLRKSDLKLTDVREISPETAILIAEAA